MKNRSFFRAFLTVFALALPCVPTQAQAACFCEGIWEWFPVTGIGYGCSPAKYAAAQSALQDAQSSDLCEGGVECLASYYQVSCEQMGGSYWQAEIHATIGCQICDD